MNERIFELIQEQDGFRGLAWSEQDKKEFAEIIVKECAEIGYSAYWSDPEGARGIHIKEQIKKHFGVE